MAMAQGLPGRAGQQVGDAFSADAANSSKSIRALAIFPRINGECAQ
jgi:hypothetical protein